MQNQKMIEEVDDLDDELDPQIPIDRRMDRIRKCLLEDPLKAPALLQEMIKFCIEDKVPPSGWKPAVKLLMDYMKNASMYKQRMMAAAISQRNMTTKVVLMREVNQPLLHTFSVEAAMARGARTRKIKLPAAVLKKTPLRKPLAYGLNQHGKLGTGSNANNIGELTPILLPKGLMISDVYMSENHTIFLMNNGTFYGAGKGENFMTNGTTGDVLEPYLLEYVSIEKWRLAIKPNCILSDTNSHFLNFNDTMKLVVGQFEGEDVIQEGPNWKLVKVKTNGLPGDFITTNLTLEDEGQYREFPIRTDGTWLDWRDQVHQIVFIICGRRVDSERLWKKLAVCKDGTVYAHTGGTLYKGKLLVAPCKADLGEEEEEDYEKSSTAIVAMMDEVVLPFAVDGFFVSSNGDSMVFYPKTIEDRKKELGCFSLPLAPPISLPKVTNTLPYFGADMRTMFKLTHWHDGLSDVYKSEVIIRKEKDWFNVGLPGLPSEKVRFVSGLLALQHFLRIDPETGVPEVISKFKDVGNKEAYEKHLKAAEKEAIEVGRRIKPVVVPASWEALEARKTQILAKGQEYLESVLKDIGDSIELLANIPLKYRRFQQDTLYCNSVSKFIKFIEKACGNNTTSSYEFLRGIVECYAPSLIDLEEVVEARIKNGDIDKEDKRFAVIRVEAIPTEYPDNFSSHHPRFHVLYTNSNEFFIKVIDPELMDHVQEGVLNLNVACHDDPEKFESMIRVFWVISRDHRSLMNYEKHPNINIAKICSTLPPSEIYTISTVDDKKIQVPSILLELYTAGYDAARRRAAVQSGRSELEFSVNVSAEAVELLMETLMDYRRFLDLDMKMKAEMFTLVDEMMIDTLKLVFSAFIVLTAEQSDAAFIGKLMELYPKLMYELIAQKRPDIVLHWPEEMFGDFLPTIHKISEIMVFGGYTNDPEDLPVTMAPDKDVDGQLVQKSWLYEKLSNKEQDQDIHWPLTKTVMLWSGYEDMKKAPKRCQGCGRDPKKGFGFGS